MIDTLSATALAWLLTYLIHSTALLSIAWLLARVRRWSPSASEVLWKSALLGGILTSTIQLQLDVQPAGTVSLRREASIIGSPTMPVSADAPALPGTPELPAAPAAVVALDTPAMRPSAEAIAVIVWATIALWLAVTYAARRLILTGRIGDRDDVADGRLIETLSALARDAGLRATPRLTATDRISSPIALGVREICVPTSALTELDREQQRSMLAHELAHLARRDPIWLATASIIERVFWMQPLNRVARRQIVMSAEFLCDDWAVRRTGSGVALARCLAQVAEWIQKSPLGVPVAGMAEERSLLVSRVARLLEGATPTAHTSRWIGVAAASVLLATVVVAPGVSGRSAKQLFASETAEPSSQPDEQSFAPADAAPDENPTAYSGAGKKHPELTNADSAVVLALIARLRDDNAEVRQAAARSLGKLGDSRAVPGLMGALADADARVRSTAADALGEFQDARALPRLIALLADPVAEVKNSVLDALGHYDDAIPSAPIVRLLSDEDAEVRRKAAHMVGHLKDRSASSALVKLLRDPNADVRQAAIEALLELRTPLPEATILALMKDANPNIRAKAAEVAGERSMIGTIPALRRLLDDPNGDVRAHAIDALTNIADPAATDALRAALSSRDAKVRRQAVEALGERRP